jgi:hypothetical protein
MKKKFYLGCIEIRNCTGRPLYRHLWLSRNCGNLDVSEPYGPPRPVTGIALLQDHIKLNPTDRCQCMPSKANCFRIHDVGLMLEMKHGDC